MVIWGAAGYFAYTYYKRLFPELPNRRGARGGREWVHPNPDIAALMKREPGTDLYMKVRPAKSGSGSDHFQQTDREGSRMIAATNVTLQDAFAMLRGVPAWQVTDLPNDNKRWDVFVRTPAEQRQQGDTNRENRRGNRPNRREELANAFLKYMGWESKEGKRPAVSYRFRKRKPEEGSAPSLSEFVSYSTRFSSGRWKPELQQALGMMGRGDIPVILNADRDVRDNRPLIPDGAEFKIPDLPDMDATVRYVTALYNVGYDKSSGEANAYLLFHPKHAVAADIQAWEEGKPVTAEEKAAAAETATDDTGTTNPS